MKLFIFAIRDAKIEAFQRPWTARSVPEALRSFTDIVNDTGSQFYAHPEDFGLFCVGEFDDTTGVISQPDGGMRHLGLAVEFKKAAA